MVETIHEEFLRLLGWEGAALKEFLPDWLHTAAFLRLSDQDVLYAVREWLPQYWDLSLLSVRKLIAACIREAAALSKMESYKKAGKKILYSNTTASHVSIYANKLAGNGELHVAFPCFIISTVCQAFFGKVQTYHGSCMSTNCQHCALNVSYANAVMDGQIPVPTVTWDWGLHCNEAPKTDEFIDCLSPEPWPVVLLTIPHDDPLGTVEMYHQRRVDYLAEEIREGQRQVSALTGIEVREEHLRQAMDQWLGYMRRIERLTHLVTNTDPQPLSGNELTQFGLCMQPCFDTGLTYINDALDTAIEEVEARIRGGAGVLPKGAPKLACHFQPPNIPWFERAFRNSGVNLTLGRIFPPASWLEEVLDEGDLYQTIARHCLMCPDAVNMRNEVDIAARLFKQFACDGALFGFFSHDRWIGALHKTMIREAEERTGIPHYYVGSDFWDGDSNSVADRLPIIRSICSSMKIARI